jgi:hypothetical protein
VLPVGGVGEHQLSVEEELEGALRADPGADLARSSRPFGGAHEGGGEHAHVLVRTHQRPGVEPAVGELERGLAPADRPLLAGVRLVSDHGLLEVELGPKLQIEARLSLVVEGTDHEPVADVSEPANLVLRRLQVAPARACVGGQQTRIHPRGRAEPAVFRGCVQGLFHVGGIGSVPGGPDAPQRRVCLRAAGGIEAGRGFDEIRVKQALRCGTRCQTQ